MILRIITLVFLLPGMLEITAQEKSWELIKDLDAIKVHINTNAENLIEIKATSYTNGEINQYYEMLSNVADYNQWMHGTKTSRIVHQEKDTKFTYYLRTDLPWPAQDRDITIETIIHYQPEQGLVYTSSQAVTGIIEPKKAVSRVKDVKASWRFENVEGQSNNIRITYHGKIKPNIWLPNWLQEIVYSEAPYQTIKNIKELHKNHE
jgi:ribosome-associated toxin RatA of RatAB toxin-antitoxin module